MVEVSKAPKLQNVTIQRNFQETWGMLRYLSLGCFKKRDEPCLIVLKAKKLK